MRAILCLVWLGSITAATTLVHADPAPAASDDKKTEAEKKNLAKEYVRAGIAAQSAGDYDTAITMFSKAFQLSPHPTLIFNSAQAHRLAGHKERALAMYRRYLELAPTGDQAQTAKDFIAELDPPPPAPVAKPAPAPVAKPAPAPVVSKPVATPAPTVPPPAAVPMPASAKPTTVASREPAVTGTLTDTPLQTDSPRDSALPWKISLGASIGVAAIGIAFGTYELIKLHDLPRYTAAIDPATNSPYTDLTAPSQNECGLSEKAIAFKTHSRILDFGQFRSACDARSRVPIGYAIGAVGVVGAAVSTYMIWRDRHSRELDAARGHHPRHDLAITPVVTRDSSSAVLSLTW